MNDYVRPKKSFGQHFLKDKNIAAKIANSLTDNSGINKVLEVGPGTGILSDFLVNSKNWAWYSVEIDKESVSFLKKKYPDYVGQIIEKDFLQLNLNKLFNENEFALIGNFPYNISSQILFKVLENKELIPEVVGMFQKEVAARVCALPGNKTYGILSVLVQAFYNTELLFYVNESVFFPPPKVKSAVIRLVRKKDNNFNCNEKLFFLVVKTAFNQRRKTLRNSLKVFKIDWEKLPDGYHNERPENLDYNSFCKIVNTIQDK